MNWAENSYIDSCKVNDKYILSQLNKYILSQLNKYILSWLAPSIVLKAATFVSSFLFTLALLTNTVSTHSQLVLESYCTHSFKLSNYICLVNPPYASFANKCCTEAPIMTSRVIPYAFPSKPSNELFLCIYFVTNSHLPGCCSHNGLTPRTATSSLRLIRYHLYGNVSCVPQQLSSRQNGEFRRYYVESSLTQ